MPYRLEITLRPELLDAEGEAIRQKAKDYFGLNIDDVRVIHILTLDAEFTAEALEKIRTEIFTNPVTQISSFEPLMVEFDWCIWIGYRPGVRDNPGSTAVEAIEDILGISLGPDEAVYTSKRYCLKCDSLSYEQIEKVAGATLLVMLFYDLFRDLLGPYAETLSLATS